MSSEMPTEVALFGDQTRPTPPRGTIPVSKEHQGLLLDVQPGDQRGQLSLLEKKP